MHALTMLRHGESQGNYDGRIQGQADLPLTNQGLEQAHRLAARWKTEGVLFDYIISSPLQRARLTAEAIAEQLGLPVELDPAWRERSFGTLEGKTTAEVDQMIPRPYFHDAYRIPFEGFESETDQHNRASSAIQALLRRPEGRYLVVSHGAFLNAVMRSIQGLAPTGHPPAMRWLFGNTAYANLVYEPARHQWSILGFTAEAPTARPGDDDQ